MPSYMDDLFSQMKGKKKGEKEEVESNAQEQPQQIEKQQEQKKAQKQEKNQSQKTGFKPNEMFSTTKEKQTQKPRQKTDTEQPPVQEEEEKQTQEVVQSAFKNGKLIDEYGEIKIYDIPSESLKLYYAPTPKPNTTEKTIINTIKEAATRLITIAPFRIRDQQERRNVYFQKVIEILQNSPQLQIPKHRFEFYAESVVREMVGYGLIDSMVNDDHIEEIMVIGPKRPVYVFHRKHEMLSTNIEFFSDQEIVDLVNRIARQIGRRVDISSPMLDARLPDGSRVNATIPPASVDGSTLTIRKFRKEPYSIVDLITERTIDPYTGAFLWTCVQGMGVKPANIIISGGAGSGKTTTLNALAAFIQPYERIITIEDTAELNMPLKHLIRLEGRPPSLEGKGEITLDVLTKNSLRMRPDRIIVGEIRHQEAFTLFTAINTGHDGSMGTLHANSSLETVVRVISPPMSVPEVMLSSLDFIVVEHRLHDKKRGTIRRITEISEVSGVLEGKTKTTPIFEYEPATDTLKRTKNKSDYIEKLSRFIGRTPDQIEKTIEKREKFLKELIDQGITKINEVTKKCLDFVENEK